MSAVCQEHGTPFGPPDANGDSWCPDCRAGSVARMAAGFSNHVSMESVARRALSVEPLCPSCLRVTADGAAEGCAACVARQVMAT